MLQTCRKTAQCPDHTHEVRGAAEVIETSTSSGSPTTPFNLVLLQLHALNCGGTYAASRQRFQGPLLTRNPCEASGQQLPELTQGITL